MNRIPPEEQRTIQLDVLEHFLDFCETNNFRYYVIDGTLLGTIRHKGYIPWDDDIDVCMPRKDYDRFLEEYPKLNKDEKYRIITRETNPLYHLAFAKMYDSRTKLKERRVLNKYQYLYGVYIDIFPLDHVPQDPEKRRRIVRSNYYLSKTISMNVIGLDVPHRSFLGKFLYTTLFYIQKIFPIRQLTYLQDKRIKKWNRQWSSSGLCKELAFQDVNSEQYFYDEDFAEYKNMPFEKLQVRVPRGYIRILENLYGDYMKLPPENERVTHGIDAYYIIE